MTGPRETTLVKAKSMMSDFRAGRSMEAIGDQWGHTPSTVSTLLKLVGLEQRVRRQLPIEEMYAQYCAGLTLAEVGQAYGCSGSLVATRFAEAGWPRRRPAETRHRTVDQLQEVVGLTGKGALTAKTIRKRSRPRPASLANVTGANANRVKAAAAASLPAVRAALLLPGVTRRDRGVLRLRLDHSEVSLAELGRLHDPPLSKDIVAGVIRRATRKVVHQ